MATQTQTRRQHLARLSIRDKLYQKGSSTDALLKRITQTRKELSEMDQDQTDVNSLKDVCKELVQPALMLHKDKRVKANVACCLADMLRLFAPNAPFTPSDLRDIFEFFLHQFTLKNSGLSDPSGPQYPEYFHVLESLSNVKSVVLVCDLSNADETMTNYFKAFFELARPDMSKNVEICMCDVLVQLIDECVTLPHQVLEMLLANFSPKAVKHTPAAHRMATEICSATKDRLQKNVAQYFNEVIINSSREEDVEQRNESLQAAHSLIIQINRAVPSILLNVIPQLEEELKAEDVQLRLLATKVLGQMFADKPAPSGEGGDLAKRYNTTWNAWLGRANDKSSIIRVMWIEATKDLLIHHPELKDDLTPIIKNKLLDPEERVRAAVARMLATLDYESALHHVDKSILIQLADRCKDKKATVRNEALEAVGKMFDMAYSEIESHDPAAIQQFAWIPSEVFKAVYAGSQQLVESLYATVEQYILPIASGLQDPAAWTNRLLVVSKFLDPQAEKALCRMTNLIYTKPSIFDRFISCCEQYNGGDVSNDKDGQVVKIAIVEQIRRCSNIFGDPLKARNDLLAFAKLNDARIYKLLNTCFDAEQDLKTLYKSRTDALRRIENANASILDTMTTFIHAGSFFILNRSSISVLIKKLQQKTSDYSASQITRESQSQDGNDTESQAKLLAKSRANLSDMEAFKQTSNQLLTFVARSCPAMYSVHVPELAKALADESNQLLVQTCLQALSAVAKWKPDKVQLDRKAIDRVAKFVLKGTPLQAKFASKLLAILGYVGVKGQSGIRSSSAQRSSVYQTLEEVLEQLAKDLASSKGERQVAVLFALGQMFKHAPDAAENVSDTVVKTILGDILLKPPSKSAAKSDESEDWVEDENIDPDLNAKLLALQVLTKRCCAFGPTNSASEMGKPMFRLLWTVLTKGEAKEMDTPAPARSRMRLQAAICILKLACHKAYEEQIGRDYFTLAFAVQDECFHVRSRMLHKLLMYLQKRRIDARFLSISFLTAFDPEEENRKMVMTYCQNNARSMTPDQRLKIFDLSFSRFLGLLANHPDFSTDSADDISQFIRYIDFFLDSLCNVKNVNLFFYLATRAKCVRDAESQGTSENLYHLSELAQLLIQRRAKQHGWPVEAYPGKIALPTDMFKPLPSKQVLTQIMNRQYLPESLVKQLNEPVKITRTPKKRSATWTTTGGESFSNRKRKSTTTTTTALKSLSRSKSSSKRRKNMGYDSDENVSLSEDDEEEDEEEGGGNESSDLTDLEE